MNSPHTGKFDTAASQYWDQFYGVHQDKFFKDRRWLFLEFPELLPSWGKDQTTSTCRDHQRAADPLQTRSRTDTEMGPHQRKDPVQNHSRMDSLYLQEAGQEQNEAAMHTSSFPGHHAAFRILEVVRVHIFCINSYLLILVFPGLLQFYLA